MMGGRQEGLPYQVRNTQPGSNVHYREEPCKTQGIYWLSKFEDVSVLFVWENGQVEPAACQRARVPSG